MLREGFNETAGQLAREEGIEVGLKLKITRKHCK
jgi:hypothetical protein